MQQDTGRSAFLALVVLIAAFNLLFPASCQAAPIKIVAAGASFPERFYDALSFAFAAELPQYSLSYTSLGSGSGKCRITNFTANCDHLDTAQPRNLDWAGTDSLHSEADHQNYPDLQMFPAVAGAAVAAYHLDGVDDLVLPKQVLADIFRKCDPALVCPPGYISFWNDSRIAAANPSIPLNVLTAAGEIQVVVRADKSGTTEIFKQSLAIFSTNFSQQMGPTNLNDGTNWPGCAHLRGNTNRGVAGMILKTPSSIGYVSWDEATSAGLKFAGMGSSVLNGDGILRANARSVGFALVEKGFSFGNNGEPPTRLTASVMGATGSEAWPMVGYTYFSVRLNTKISTCEVRRAVLHWFEWFYTSATVVDIAVNQGFITQPDEGRAYIRQKIQSMFRCDGVLLYDNATNYPVAASASARTVGVSVFVSPEIAAVVDLYRDAYRFGPTGFGKVTVEPVTSEYSVIVQSTEILVLDFYQLRTNPGLFSSRRQLLLPFAGIPWGITYNFCDVRNATTCALLGVDLILTPQLAMDVVSGRITYWNDSSIKALQETPAQAEALPFLPIRLVGYAAGVRERVMFEQLAADQSLDLDLLSAVPDFIAPSYEEAARLVAAFPGAATYGPINRNTDQTLSRVARMIRESTVTTGDADSVKSCITNAMSSPTLTAFDLEISTNANCWPLANSYFVSIASGFSNEDCLNRAAQEAAYFAEFLLRPFDESTQDPLSQLGMASLDVDSTNDLASLACFGRSITSATVDMQLLPVALAWIVRAVGIAYLIGIMSLALWIWRHRSEPVLRASSPVFMWQMCLGFLLEVMAVFPLTVQEAAGVGQLELDTACMAAPWLYVVGFTLVYGSLLAKTWRIYKIFNNPAMKRVFITASYLSRLEFLCAIPIVLILILWTVLDPFTWRRVVSSVDPTTGLEIATKGECSSNNLINYLVPIICIFATYIIVGLVLAWKNRTAPTEFSEGRYVTGAIMTDTELLIIAIPVLVITSGNPIAAFVVKVCFIFLSVGATIVVFFYPKYAILNGFWQIDASSSNMLPPKNPERRSRKDHKHDGSSGADPAISNNRWSTQLPITPQGSSAHRKGSFFRTGSSENMKGLIPYIKQNSWFGTIEDKSSDSLNEAVGDKPKNNHSGSASLTPHEVTPNVSGDNLEIPETPGGKASMFFGSHVV